MKEVEIESVFLRDEHITNGIIKQFFGSDSLVSHSGFCQTLPGMRTGGNI